MKLLSVGGRDLSKLHVYSYEIGLETLDGEGTGRTKANFWPLIRDPQGSILNLYLEIATTKSTDPDFVYLWRVCKSMGKTEFVKVEFIDPVGDRISQNMYVVLPRLKLKHIQKDGVIYTDAIKVNFIAEMGQ